MSNKSAGNTQAARREEARKLAEKMKKEQERAERRSRMIILISVIAGLAVVGGLIAFILSKAPKDIAADITAIPADVAAPSNADEIGAFTYYKGEMIDEAPADVPVMDVYLDMMCHYCAQFEATHADWLRQAADNGELVYRIHPVAVTNSSYATTLGAVYASLLERDPKQSFDFAIWAFDNQNANGLSDDQITTFLKNVGVSDSDIDDALSGKYERFLRASSIIANNDPDLKNADGYFGTPSVFLNNARLTAQWNDEEAFKAEVEKAITDAGSNK